MRRFLWTAISEVLDRFSCFFFLPSTQCADEPSNDKSPKFYQFNSFWKYFVFRVIA